MPAVNFDRCSEEKSLFEKTWVLPDIEKIGRAKRETPNLPRHLQVPGAQLAKAEIRRSEMKQAVSVLPDIEKIG